MSFIFVIMFACLFLVILSILSAVFVSIDVVEITSILVATISGVATLCFLVVGIIQPISLKQLMIRQNKEREQIVFQINNLNDNSDKVKINEWILTYNDWINDVNTSKEFFGFWSWYYSFDMTNHTIIILV